MNPDEPRIPFWKSDRMELHRRLNGTKIRQFHFIGLDFEDDGYGNMTHWALAGLKKVPTRKRGKYSYNDVEYKASGTDPQELKKALLSLNKRQCHLVFFNLGYDIKYLDDIDIVDNDPKKTFVVGRKINPDGTVFNRGVRAIKVILKNGIHCYDLHNLFWRECQLRDVIDGLHYTEKYGIVKDYFDPLTGYPDPLKQCENDAMAAALAMMEIEEYSVKTLKINISHTISQHALKLFKTHFFTDWWERDPKKQAKLIALENRALIGGRSEIFKKQGTPTTEIIEADINKAYLFSYKDALFPDINRVRYYGHSHPKWKEIFMSNKYQGIYNVHIKSPSMEALHGTPVLPRRDPKKPKEHIIYPVGEWWETYTSEELYHAVTQYGYEVLECKEFCIYTLSKPYFKKMAEFIEAEILKFEASSDKFMIKFHKTLANELYGKLAQMNPVEVYTLDGWEIMEAQKQGFVVNKIRYEDGEEMFIIDKGRQPTRHTFRAISAFIASDTRMRVGDAIFDNAEYAIACETDSIKLVKGCPMKGIEINPKVGAWKVESICQQVIGCKAVINPGPDGTVRYKIRGVGKIEQKLIEETPEYLRIQFRKPVRNAEARRRGVQDNTWVMASKKVSLKDTKRNWYQDGTSTPLCIQDPIYVQLRR